MERGWGGGRQGKKTHTKTQMFLLDSDINIHQYTGAQSHLLDTLSPSVSFSNETDTQKGLQSDPVPWEWYTVGLGHHGTETG